MKGRRLRGIVGVVVAIVCSVVVSSQAESTGREYSHDGVTTYCWGVNANVTANDVSQDLIFARGTKRECPLQLTLELIPGTYASLNDEVKAIWTVRPNASSAAVFSVANARPLVDATTRKRATIIHSNVHACHLGQGCDPFTRGELSKNATMNQVGNVSDSLSTFTTNELRFSEPGEYVILAHVIVPGQTFDVRYDFAVFSTIVITGSSTMENDTTVNKEAATTSTHALSKAQVIILCIVGGLLLILLLLVIAYSARKTRRRNLCHIKIHGREPSSTSKSGFSGQPSNLRTRSSDWTDLYAIDDSLPSSVMVDDSNTIAILRSSRASTPSCSPMSFSQERKVADFRHDVARWDVRSSASPITPSSSAVMIAAIQDPDQIASTPASDCFVPLESLVPISPMPVKLETPSRWIKHSRGGAKSSQMRHPYPYMPDDSGDEQEVDI